MAYASSTESRARPGAHPPRPPAPEPRGAVPLDEFWRRLDAMPQR